MCVCTHACIYACRYVFEDASGDDWQMRRNVNVVERSRQFADALGGGTTCRRVMRVCVVTIISLIGLAFYVGGSSCGIVTVVVVVVVIGLAGF
jgi:hypothetical protein